MVKVFPNFFHWPLYMIRYKQVYFQFLLEFDFSSFKFTFQFLYIVNFRVILSLTSMRYELTSTHRKLITYFIQFFDFVWISTWWSWFLYTSEYISVFPYTSFFAWRYLHLFYACWVHWILPDQIHYCLDNIMLLEVVQSIPLSFFLFLLGGITLFEIALFESILP